MRREERSGLSFSDRRRVELRPVRRGPRGCCDGSCPGVWLRGVLSLMRRCSQRGLVGARPSALAFALLSLACDARSPNPGPERPGDATPGAVVETAEPVVTADPDPDGDGFCGADDRCPEEPGIEPDGCPLRDGDGDGILDPEDRCPDACEVINGVDDDDGCPDPNPGDHPEIQALLGPIEGLVFQVDKDRIKRVSFPALDRIAEVLIRHPQVKIAVEGHGEEVGDHVGLPGAH